MPPDKEPLYDSRRVYVPGGVPLTPGQPSAPAVDLTSVAEEVVATFRALPESPRKFVLDQVHAAFCRYCAAERPKGERCPCIDVE